METNLDYRLDAEALPSRFLLMFAVSIERCEAERCHVTESHLYSAFLDAFVSVQA